jgi:hypothetical protein
MFNGLLKSTGVDNRIHGGRRIVTMATMLFSYSREGRRWISTDIY